MEQLKSKLMPEKKKPALHTIKPKQEKKQEIVKQEETKEQVEQENPTKKREKQVEKGESLDTSALLKRKKNRDL